MNCPACNNELKAVSVTGIQVQTCAGSCGGLWFERPAVKKLKDRKLLVVCKSGQTAVPAAANLRKMGAAEVAILKGGMSQWSADQYPVTTKK